MGARSKEKVLEIIQTGTLRRNEMLADDLEQQTIQLVTLHLLQTLLMGLMTAALSSAP